MVGSFWGKFYRFSEVLVRNFILVVIFVFLFSIRAFCGEQELRQLKEEFQRGLTVEMLQKPTYQLYQVDGSKKDASKKGVKTSLLYGKYKEVRGTLDYSYHPYYTERRQLLQDEIIDYYLNTVRSSAERLSTSRLEHPKLIFSAGPMGAGKSRTLRYLDELGQLPLSQFVMIDMDQIRYQLPEIQRYIELDSLNAGNNTNREAGYIQEIIFEQALREGWNIIVDSSLKDVKWNQELFEAIKQKYPHYYIEIYSIQTDLEKIYERVKKRELETGRVVPKCVIEESIPLTSHSIEVLKDIADLTLYLDNNSATPCKIKEYRSRESRIKGVDSYQIIQIKDCVKQKEVSS